MKSYQNWSDITWWTLLETNTQIVKKINWHWEIPLSKFQTRWAHLYFETCTECYSQDQRVDINSTERLFWKRNKPWKNFILI